jgi:hypothetical protein
MTILTHTNNMTPKEKADDLVQEMYAVLSNSPSDISYYFSKHCALVCVDELIRIAPWGSDIDGEIEDDSKEYYIEVKQEIKKL